MSTITYSNSGSRTTTSISQAPAIVQALWNEAGNVNACILRIRSTKERNDLSVGKTFTAYHNGRVSVYIPRKTPSKTLWFKRILGIGATNPRMQILEMPSANGIADIQEAYDVVRAVRIHSMNN